MDVILESFTWDWTRVIVDLLRVAIAFALAFPIGWERRSRTARSLGLRTFPLVAVASCGYVLLVKESPTAEVDDELMGRVLQGLLTGIGFIGGGTILKDKGSVYGLATAASIWNTGAVGAAVAYEREEIAVVLSIINFALLWFLTPVVEKGHDPIDNDSDRRALPRDRTEGDDE